MNPRMQIGINLLPAIVAADTSMGQQPADSKITVYVVYGQRPDLARSAAELVNKRQSIKGRVLSVQALSANELLAGAPQKPAILLLAEPLNGKLKPLIDYASSHYLILFSPFKGDVERGAMAGIEITHKVLPAVNMTSIRQANINLKAFFLRIAVKYE